ncbi:MAG: hypothetical protein KC636_17895 [Myxococcales bacterium]|nr:hypothetical protein [Myxococcales bacterium]
MITEARFSYALRFSLRVPLVREAAEEGESAFDHHLVELLHIDKDGDDEVTARALVYRVRRHEVVDVLLAADADGYTELLEYVCAEALEADGSCTSSFTDALGDVGDPLILDSIEFVQPLHDAPMLRAMIARGILDTLGRGMELMFLPGGERDFPIWERALGAVRVGDFTVASAGIELPEFPPPGTFGDCN